MNTNTVTPTYSEEDVLEAMRHCSKVIDSLAAKRALKRCGYDFSYEVPPSRRWLVISTLNLAAKKHEQQMKGRTNRVNKSDVHVRINVQPLKNSIGAIEKQIRLMTGAQPRTLLQSRAMTYAVKAENMYVKLAFGNADPAAVAAWRHLAARYNKIAGRKTAPTMNFDLPARVEKKSAQRYASGGYTGYTPPLRNPSAPAHHQV